jgi:hypothetical protein
VTPPSTKAPTTEAKSTTAQDSTAPPTSALQTTLAPATAAQTTLAPEFTTVTPPSTKAPTTEAKSTTAPVSTVPPIVSAPRTTPAPTTEAQTTATLASTTTQSIDTSAQDEMTTTWYFECELCPFSTNISDYPINDTCTDGVDLFDEVDWDTTTRLPVTVAGPAKTTQAKSDCLEIIKKVFDKLDLDHNGNVTEQELVAYVKNKTGELIPKCILCKIFEDIDKNRDRVITCAELQKEALCLLLNLLLIPFRANIFVRICVKIALRLTLGC